jgi:hypothetical protein
MNKSFFYILLFSIIGICYITRSNVLPSSGENGKFYKPGEELLIQWDFSDFNGPVNIYIWDGTRLKFDTIANSVISETGTYKWNIPLDFPVGKRFRLKIQEVTNPSLYKMSRGIFTINFHPMFKQATQEMQFEVNSHLVYPNPSNEFISILSNDVKAIAIYDMMGKILLSQDYTGVEQISLSTIPSGIYFVMVTTGSSQHIEKLIKL